MEFTGITEALKELYNVLYYGLGIANLGVAGVVLIYGIIAGLVTAIFEMLLSILLFVLQAFPLFKISRKVERKSAYLVWLSWLPVIGGYLSTYVLADIPGNKPLNLTNKVSIQNRLLSFWMYIGIGVFGPTLITTFMGIFGIIPILGQILAFCSVILYIIPAAAVAWFEYAYLRDVLDVFNQNHNSNRNAAIIITVLDSLVTFGFARAFYLYTIINKEPLDRAQCSQ